MAPADTPDRKSRTDASQARAFIAFLRENKVWWITPLVVALLLFAGLLLLSSAATSPFVYKLF